jgi:hypothetical protein
MVINHRTLRTGTIPFDTPYNPTAIVHNLLNSVLWWVRYRLCSVVGSTELDTV